MRNIAGKDVMTSQSLRLLAAARHAYEIEDQDGVVPDAGWTPTPYGYVGYTDAPIGFRAGADNQDGGFTATVPEGVIVSIRGTTPPRLLGAAPQQVVIDWASDAVASLIGAGGQPPGFPGKVHLGFYKSFMRLWLKLGPIVHEKADAWVAANPGSPLTLFVTGHSKGGAICALVAWRLRLDYPNAKLVVRSFAGARIGDDQFAGAYNAAIPDHIRYEYDDDIVPHLPLSPDVIEELGVPKFLAALLSVADVGYCPVGRLGYIATDDSIAFDDSPALEERRVAALIARARATDGLKYIVSCHGVDPPTDGYFKAAYQD